ncbi:tyrosine--tRNA ligase [Armatimonas rosea]|uniref:tyrosine--tRNA ligase n=1 Tax=Armatimonas rosea TaxID=685828 RepID=UPI00161E6153|nr:tyrosine--tRNA ligase [Armatimonas rosea]
MSDVTIEEQVELLARGASLIVPENGLKAKLEKSAKTGKPLIVKLGLDPTAPDIHLGFAVVLRKMRQFQDLGHRVTIIIGDYTTLIGDPSGRSATRPMLSSEQIAENAATYVEQLSVILDREKTDVRFNSEWLGKLSFADLVKLTSKITVAQVLTRDDFKKRWDASQPISLHELLYPLAQGYDSVAIQADVEMGGLDQTFNILTGRELQSDPEIGQDPQIGFFMPLLVGLDGQKKMSKSLGNYIGIAEPALSQYSKVMSLGDEQMSMYFLLCTDVPVAAFEEILKAPNPMEAKHRLATEIVTIYHGPDEAQAASAEWKRIHSARQFPSDAPELVVPESPINIVALVRHAGFAPSNGEARRLIEQGGVKLNGEKISDPAALITITDNAEFQVGRKNFARLKL